MPTIPPVPTQGPRAALRVGFAGSIGRDCFSDLLLRAGAGIEPAYSSASRKCLLADLAAGRLDAAVYPGPASPGAASARLCRDRLAAALAPGHKLAGRDAVALAALGPRPLLLPADGDEGEFRRLARALLPALGPTQDVPGRDLPRRLGVDGPVGLLALSQGEELGGAAVLVPLSDPRAHFEVHISWTPAAAAGAFGRLLPELGV